MRYVLKDQVINAGGAQADNIAAGANDGVQQNYAVQYNVAPTRYIFHEGAWWAFMPNVDGNGVFHPWVFGGVPEGAQAIMDRDGIYVFMSYAAHA